MTATLLALVGAVLTAVLYVALTDRMDYATVQRRQLDLWVAVVGFVCLTTILYGAADVRREQHRAPQLAPTAGASQDLIVRRADVDLHHEIAPIDAPPLGALTDATHPDAPIADVAAAAVAAEARTDLRYALPAVGAPTPSPLAQASTPTPMETREPMPAWRGVITPVIQILPLATPTLTPIPVALASPIVVPIRHDPTRAAPTAVPPTDLPVPVPPPSPTPQCGDPDDIRVTVQVVDVSVERGDRPPTVRFRAEARNSSSFPVTFRDVAVVVESSAPGSDQFGHLRPRDVAVGAGVLHVFEGVVTLTKSPSPFESTQVCLSLVTESCGRFTPYHVTKHCLAARGF